LVQDCTLATNYQKKRELNQNCNNKFHFFWHIFKILCIKIDTWNVMCVLIDAIERFPNHFSHNWIFSWNRFFLFFFTSFFSFGMLTKSREAVRIFQISRKTKNIWKTPGMFAKALALKAVIFFRSDIFVFLIKNFNLIFTFFIKKFPRECCRTSFFSRRRWTWNWTSELQRFNNLRHRVGASRCQ